MILSLSCGYLQISTADDEAAVENEEGSGGIEMPIVSDKVTRNFFEERKWKKSSFARS